jgi:hypothetical protein
MSRLAEHFGVEAYQTDYKPAPRSPLLMPEDVPIDVCVLFESYALQAVKAGVARYSADAILHRIRWHHQVEKGNRDWKANNNWTSALARWFIAKHPDKAGFFETRKLKEERDGQAV